MCEIVLCVDYNAPNIENIVHKCSIATFFTPAQIKKVNSIINIIGFSVTCPSTELLVDL